MRLDIINWIQSSMIVVVVLAALMLVLYVLAAAAIMQIARRRGLRLSGLAWVPFLSMFVLGSIVDDITRRVYGKIFGFKWILPALSILPVLFLLLNLGFLLAAIAYLVNCAALAFAYFLFYRDYSDAYVVLTVFTVIIPLVLPFSAFMLKDRMPVTIRFAREQARRHQGHR